MFVSLSLRVAAGRFLAGMTVLATGAGGGAVLGFVNLGGQPSAQAHTTRIAALGAPTLVEVGDLVVQESPQPVQPVAPPAAPPVQRTIRIVQAPKSAPSAARVAAPVLNLPSISTASVVCDRLDDSKIQWLLRLVAKTKAANPASAQVADQVNAQLVGSLGKNMCASEAQSHVAAMCADPAVFDFMQKMVKELPFFVRPLVGNPCEKDLVAAAQKWLP
jgi:hypothetical protein